MNAAVGGPGGPRRGASARAPAAVLGELTSLMSRRIQHALDATVPHTGARWGATAGLALLYALRVWALGGFYIVTYGLGIYLLNLFIGFITPQVRARGARGRVRQQEGGRVEEERGWWLGTRRNRFPASAARRSTRRPRARCCHAAAPKSTGRTLAGCPSLSFGAGARAPSPRALSLSLSLSCAHALDDLLPPLLFLAFVTGTPA